MKRAGKIAGSPPEGKSGFDGGIRGLGGLRWSQGLAETLSVLPTEHEHGDDTHKAKNAKYSIRFLLGRHSLQQRAVASCIVRG